MAPIHFRSGRYVLAGLIAVLLPACASAQCRIDQLTDTTPAPTQRFWIFDSNAVAEPMCGRNRSLTVSDLFGSSVPLPFTGVLVKELDGAPSVAAVDTVVLDQTDGFVLTDSGSNDIRIDLAAIPDSVLAESYSGVGACAVGQAVTTLNDHSAPTCSAVAGSPGGSDTQVQFNDAGSFGGDAGLTYNKTTNILTFTGGTIQSANTSGPQLKDETASNVNPTILPDRSTTNSGLGSASGNPVLINSGQELLRAATGQVLIGGGGAAALVLSHQGRVSFEEASGANILYFEAPAAVTSDHACTLRDDSRFIPASCVEDNFTGSGGAAAGNDTEIQYNDMGAFGASSKFIWDDSISEMIALNSSAGSPVTLLARHSENANASSNSQIIAQSGSAGKPILFLSSNAGFRASFTGTVAEGLEIATGPSLVPALTIDSSQVVGIQPVSSTKVMYLNNQGVTVQNDDAGEDTFLYLHQNENANAASTVDLYLTPGNAAPVTIWFADNVADRGAIQSTTADNMVFKTGSSLTTALTLEADQDVIIADQDRGDISISSGTWSIDANSVALGTDTTGNYVATIADAGSTTITVANSGAESAAVTLDAVDVHCTGCLSATELAADSVDSSEIAANAVTASEIAADAVTEDKLKAVDSPADEECLTYESTGGDFEWQACSSSSGDITDVFSCATGDCSSIALADGDFLDASAVNVSSTTEGILLPQATSCASGTAEGQICWDTDDNRLYVGDVAAPKVIGSSMWASSTAGSTLSASATNYFPLFAGASPSTNETTVHNIAPSGFIPTILSCSLNADPDNGAGTQSYTLTVRVGAADTDWACAISDGATTCTDTSGSAIAAGNVDIKSIPANTPTARSARCAITFSL